MIAPCSVQQASFKQQQQQQQHEHNNSACGAHFSVHVSLNFDGNADKNAIVDRLYSLFYFQTVRTNLS